MKKYIIIVLITILLVSSLATALEISVQKSSNIGREDFTHAVFAEDASTTWCTYCPITSRALYSIYNSSDYPFNYVTLLSNVNPIAQSRTRQLNVYSIPIVYFDGGVSTKTGAVQETEYRSLLEETGIRSVARPLGMTTNVTWEDNATMTITVSITNNGNLFYLGILKSYITEIESRWLDLDGDPFHFALLDFAFKKIVFIRPGKTYTDSMVWDGTETHGNQTFEDITQDNIMVISTASHWIPHLNRTDTDRLFLAFYVDQTSAGIPQ